MKSLMNKIRTIAFVMCVALVIGACQQQDQTQTRQVPVAIQASDECHVCGMNIQSFPGPKGQAFVRGRAAPFKFCSTADTFSWLLQPDSAAIVTSAFVHDMGAAPEWDKPSEAHYVNVKQAWYVVGHDMPGAMGPTLASFKQKQDAEKFVKQHGGRILRYPDINLALLANLSK